VAVDISILFIPTASVVVVVVNAEEVDLVAVVVSVYDGEDDNDDEENDDDDCTASAEVDVKVGAGGTAAGSAWEEATRSSIIMTSGRSNMVMVVSNKRGTNEKNVTLNFFNRILLPVSLTDLSEHSFCMLVCFWSRTCF